MSNGAYRRRARVDAMDAAQLTAPVLQNPQYTDYSGVEPPTRSVRTTTALTGTLLLTDEVVYSTLDSAGKAFSLPTGAPVGKSILVYSQTSGPYDFTIMAPGGGGIITPQTPGSVVSAVAINRYCGRFIHIGGGVWFESGRCPLDVVPTFIITVERSSAGNVTFSVGGTTNNFAIDWGDGTVESINSAGTKTHAYAASGTYTVMMAGVVEDFKRGTTAGSFLRTIEQFDGALTYSSVVSDAFGSCGLTAVNAEDAPLFGVGLSSFIYAFFGNTGFNTFNAIGQALWQPPPVRTALFYGCSSLNKAIDAALFVGATDVSAFFQNCTAYNNNGVDMDSIVVSSGCVAAAMFSGCAAFNVKPPTFTDLISDAGSVFVGCTLFNKPLTGWVVNASVVNESFMFYNAAAFNQNVDHILGAGVTTVQSMFEGATAFKNGGAPLAWASSGVQTWADFMKNCAFNQPILVSGGSGLSFTGATNCGAAFSSTGANKFTNGGTPVYVDFGNAAGSRTLVLSDMFAGSGVPAAITLVLPTQAATTIAMNNTFNYANFNADLSAMDIRRVTSGFGTFAATAWSQANFEATLIGWGTTQAATSPSSRNMTLTGLNLYVPLPGTAARTAYDALVAKSWTFTGLLPSPMVMTWAQTPADGFVSLQVGGTFSVRVDWDDGAGFGAPTSSAPTHTYASATATRTIKVLIVSGTPTFTMQANTSTMKLTTVENWGGIRLSGAGLWFVAIVTLTAINASDAPILTGATSFNQAFNACPLTTFNGMANWVIPSGMNMQYCFANGCRLGSSFTFPASWFNSPTSVVGFVSSNDPNTYFNASFDPAITFTGISVELFFDNCRAFNKTPPMVVGAPKLDAFFRNCTSFNQPLGWTQTATASCTSFFEMFKGCTVFNQDVEAAFTGGATFVTSAAVNMRGMFSNCTAFTGTAAIGSWDTTNVTTMERVFQQCPAFNRNVVGAGKWNLKKLTSLNACFFLATTFNNAGVDVVLDLDSTYNRAISLSNVFFLSALNVNVIDSFPSGPGTTITMDSMFNLSPYTGTTISATFVNSRVTTMMAMFCECTSFVGNANMLNWDVSGVQSFGAGGSNGGCFFKTLFDQPIMQTAAPNWRATLDLCPDVEDMFGQSAFTNGGQQVVYKPVTVDPLNCAAMFRGCAITDMDLDFGAGTPQSVRLRNAAGFLFGVPFNSPLSNCRLDRAIYSTGAAMSITSTALSQANFETMITLWGITRLAFAPHFAVLGFLLNFNFSESTLSPTAATAVANLRAAPYLWQIDLRP